MAPAAAQSDILHATCVSYAGAGVLITGPSGSGKSALALQLMALGAELVADDRTLLSVIDDQVQASCPKPLRGLIEARFVGLLAVPPAAPAFLRLVVDMATPETERLPPRREITLMGCKINLLHYVAHAHFPAAILQYLKGGRYA